MGYHETFSEYADAFDATVAQVRPEAWGAASPCEGWTAADVVRHVVDSQRAFLDRQGVPAGDVPADPPDAVWLAHRATVDRLLADGTGDREFDGFFGRTTIGDNLASFYGFDLVVHRWDLARAAGVACRFSDAELDQLEASLNAFGEHLYDPGVCARPVPVPDDAPRQDRLLALMGRDPDWS